MRLWSLHPSYLDAKGLVAVWREALLARAVLRGATKGYKHHAQLERFRKCRRPLAAINSYLSGINDEALRRGYKFDSRKLGPPSRGPVLTVTRGQLRYELEHLKKKLRTRDTQRYNKLATLKRVHPHPLFRVIAGTVESWERL
ncbi:MAG: pyrimidine dimer DNA glycosylase/endonuclease V [Bacteroidota bacterium]